MKPGKSPIGGHQISRKEALKGLGDPKKWKKEAEALYEEFGKKPAKPKPSMIDRAACAIKKVLAAKAKRHLEPVYAKKSNRPTAAKPKTRKIRSRNR